MSSESPSGPGTNSSDRRRSAGTVNCASSANAMAARGLFMSAAVSDASVTRYTASDSDDDDDNGGGDVSCQQSTKRAAHSVNVAKEIDETRPKLNKCLVRADAETPDRSRHDPSADFDRTN